MPADTRARVTSAGGKARAATMSTADREKAARAGGAAINSLPGLAKRLVAKWKTASDAERAEAEAILAGLPKR